ncbi:beta strand repeat-containing protein [Amphibiibacter pelophylacis]|uniref:Hemagglutinin repeat-containing protein n=1 Tax=Amphibiibacter pelophylacis TaxID=1799477 RepID=A0ACC6P2J8_9BURK
MPSIASRKTFRTSTLVSSLTVAGLMAASAAHAQGLDAAAGSGVTVTQQQNVPVVQIATPSAQGLSHNRFSNYSVGAAGVVLNNARQAVNTQLAGQVQANPNLSGGTAKVILNEVVGSSVTTITGTHEIAGDKAALIVANPNGLSATNASFINTSRATLLAGRPEVADGQLKALVTDPAAVLYVNGAQNTAGDQLDLIATQVLIGSDPDAAGKKPRLDGGKMLSVIGGSNRVDYAKSARDGFTEASITPVNPAAPFAAPVQKQIDTAALGIATTGRISVLDTYAPPVDASAAVVSAPKKVLKGTVTDVGTQIKAGGSLNDSAGTVISKAAVGQVNTKVDTLSVSVDIGGKADVSAIGRPVYNAAQTIITGGSVLEAGKTAATALTPVIKDSISSGKPPVTFTFGIGVDVKTSSATSQATTALASKTESGASVNLTGKDNVTLVGTDIAAKDNINVKGGTVNLNAAQTSTAGTSKSTDVGVDLSLKLDTKANATFGLDVSVQNGSGNTASTTAKGVNLNAGKDLNVAADKGLSTQAATLTSGGNTRLSGSTVSLGSATNTQSENKQSSGGSGSLSVSANLVSGTVSGAGIGVKVNNSASSSASSTEVGNTLTSGGKVDVTSGDSLLFKGAVLAKDDVTLKAGGDVTVDSLKGSTSASNKAMTAEAGLSLSFADGAVGGGKANFGFTDSKGNSATSTATGSSITSGGNATVTAGKDVNLAGTAIKVVKNISLGAGQNVNALPTTSTTASNSSSLGVKVGVEATSTSATGTFGFNNGKDSASSSTQNGGSLTSGGNTTVQAGKNVQIASDIKAGGTTTVSAPGKIDVLATSSSSSSSSSKVGVDLGLTLGWGTSGLTSGSGNVGVDVSSSQAASQAQAGSKVDSGVDVGVASGKDLTLTGTQVSAGNNVALTAGGNLNLNPAKGSSSSSSSSVGVKADVTVSDAKKGAGFDVSVANSQASATTQQGVNVTGGNNVTLGAGKDLSLTGSATAGNNLTLTAPGRISVVAPVSTENKTSSSTAVGAGVNVNFTSGAPSSGDGRLNVALSNSKLQSSTATGGALGATKGDLTVTAGKDVSTQGTAITAGKNATIAAGGNVSLGSANSGIVSTSSDLVVNPTVSADPKTGGTGTLKITVNRSSTNNSTQAPTTVNAGNNITVTSGGNVLLTGDAKAGNSVSITAAGPVTVAATTNTVNQLDQKFGLDTSATLNLDASKGFQKGAFKIDLNSLGSTQNSITTTPAVISAGSGNVTIQSGGPLTLVGTQISAPKGTASISAPSIVRRTVKSSASSSTQPTVNISGSASLDKGKIDTIVAAAKDVASLNFKDTTNLEAAAAINPQDIASGTVPVISIQPGSSSSSSSSTAVKISDQKTR